MNITKEQYDYTAMNYEVGDTVLHPEFGYGEIFHLQDGMADIMFEGIYETKYLPLTDLVNEIGK